jgi:hypothetical protein
MRSRRLHSDQRYIRSPLSSDRLATPSKTTNNVNYDILDRLSLQRSKYETESSKPGAYKQNLAWVIRKEQEDGPKLNHRKLSNSGTETGWI